MLISLAEAGPAGAGTAAEPEITDAAGDANAVTPQRFIFVWPFGDYGSGPDTRPASVDGADLRAVWFETTYSTSKTVDPSSGEIRTVSYTPTGLRVNIKTEGPLASP